MAAEAEARDAIDSSAPIASTGSARVFPMDIAPVVAIDESVGRPDDPPQDPGDGDGDDDGGDDDDGSPAADPYDDPRVQ
eukprot:3695958-Heterocapsa_arctica.AAC.1